MDVQRFLGDFQGEILRCCTGGKAWWPHGSIRRIHGSFSKKCGVFEFRGDTNQTQNDQTIQIGDLLFYPWGWFVVEFFPWIWKMTSTSWVFFPSKEAVAWTGRHSSQTKNRMAFGLVWWLDIVKWRDPHRKSSRGSSHCEQLQWSVDLKLLCTSPNNCILFFFQWSFPGNTIDCSNIRFNQLEVDFTISSPFRQWIFT